ncbi:MAG: DegT/DnrJ/EryC1/StrS family aminotransferase, partial [Hymenobacter sp.]
MHVTIREEMLAAMTRVYDAQWYVLGEEVARFEVEYSQFNKVAHTIGVGNGLEALTLTLLGLGIGPGDEVIVPSNTYIATWLAVSNSGAVPVPVEPELTTSNLDPAQLTAALTSRTRCILPVHLYGQPCRMPEIMTFAQQHGLWVVEDNAQAHGAQLNEQLTGSFGVASATSFYPTKNLGALGDAGAITTSDASLAQRLQLFRNYGSAQKNQHEFIGYNSRLDELQAALLRVKLSHLPAWTQQRRQLAAWYQIYLADISALRLPVTIAGASPVWHLYVVHTAQRDALQQYLAASNIGTQIHYPTPPHLQPAYAHLNWAVGTLPV